jgi:hypothetical protein
VTDGGYNFNSVDASATNFRVYITDNDRQLSEGSTMLDQEWLGVVSDGINGKDTYSIELTNDVGTIPLEPNGQIDTQAGDVTTSIQMLKGNVVITEKDGVTYKMNVTKSDAITLTEEGVLTIHPNNFTSASDIPQSIELSAVHGSVTLKKVFRINVSQNAYELIPYKTMLQRDLTTGKLVSSDKKLKVSVRKWDSETNE